MNRPTFGGALHVVTPWLAAVGMVLLLGMEDMPGKIFGLTVLVLSASIWALTNHSSK